MFGMERKLFRKGHFNLIIKYIHNYSSTLHTDCKNYTAVVVIDYYYMYVTGYTSN